MLLDVQGLCAGYAGNDVVHDVTLGVREQEAVAIIGSNGAGKTTLLSAVCGLLASTAGTVAFGDRDVTRHGRTPPGPRRHRLRPRRAVPVPRDDGGGEPGARRVPRRPDPAQHDRVFALFPRLAERRNQHAGTMSGGEQQMLALGRALMSRPALLILDEPTTGLAPKLAAAAYEALRLLKQDGMTLLLAEQQVPLALELADRGYVLEDGRMELEGAADDLRSNPDVRRAYLGIA